MAAQTNQWQRTTTDLQRQARNFLLRILDIGNALQFPRSQVQKYRSEVQDTKEENIALKLKIQELENDLAKERRSFCIMSNVDVSLNLIVLFITGQWHPIYTKTLGAIRKILKREGLQPHPQVIGLQTIAT